MDNLEFLKLGIPGIYMHFFLREECRKAAHRVLGMMAPSESLF